MDDPVHARLEVHSEYSGENRKKNIMIQKEESFKVRYK
jgi:hypothetical protein